MELRRIWKRGLWLVMSLWLFACGPEEISCPKVDGIFEPTYVPLNTTCAPLSYPNNVNFNSGPGGGGVNVVMRVNDDVKTEVVMKGCTMRMTQLVSQKGTGTPVRHISGEYLQIVSETEVEGEVFVTVYDDVGQPSCSGRYDARFTKNTAVLGGAAQ